MTPEEYKEKMRAIEDDYLDSQRAVQRRYAQENNTVKPGDIVEDHTGKILVDNIRFSVSSGHVPTCIYSGKALKKDGSPKKSGETRDAWQTNLVHIEVMQ